MYILYIVCTIYSKNEYTTFVILLPSWDLQSQLRHFVEFHKSSPMATWDSKVSIGCSYQVRGFPAELG